MSRMLFLRDIQVDIQMRCRDCGHEGVLARPDLERRFGPNYPVLSIAPHYRCSRCNSKDVESRPASEAGASFASVAAQPEDFGGAIGALQGLLQAVRGDREEEDVRDLMDDGLLDTLVEEPEDEPPPGSPLELALAALRNAPPEEEPAPPARGEDRHLSDLDAFEELMSKLTPARIHGEDEGPEPAPPPAPPAASDDDSPFEESLAALRALTSAPEDEEDETSEEEPEDLDDIPTDEILSFAIRDPDARPEPAPAPEREAARFEEIRDEDDEEEEADILPFRRPPPQPGSLDESLAALRALVEKAAADEPEDRRSEPPPDAARLEPGAADEEPEEEEPPPVKTAQEKSLEETLAQLRGMLDLDNDSGEDGEPVIKPRRR